MGSSTAGSYEDLEGSVAQTGLSVAAATPESQSVTIEDGEWLLGAQFQRHGTDLIARGEGGHELIVHDYFATAQAPDLDLGDCVLRGHVVERLAGPLAPGQIAQLGAADVSAIGSVESVIGQAWVTRTDGTREALGQSSAIYSGDVLETGSSGGLAIAFVDNTTLSLSDNARMVIDELVYSPASSDNSASFSLVQGLFVLVSGDVAKSGEMTVETPVSTIGIRGTSVAIQAATEGLRNLITLLQDPDGHVGIVEVATAVASVILSAIGETTSVTSATEAPSAIEVLTSADVETLYRAALATMQTMRGSSLGVTSGAEGETPDRLDGGDSPTDDGADAQPADAEIQSFAAAIVDLFAALADELDEQAAEEEQEDLPEDLGEDPPDTTTPTIVSLPEKTRTDTTTGTTTTTTNHAPKAVADAATLSESSAGIAIAVLANDTDADSDPLTITSINTTGLHGLATIVNGEIFYQTNGAFDSLNAGETAIDTLTYTISDGRGAASTATVTVTITGENDPAPVSSTVTTVTEANGDAFLQGSFIEIGVSANGTLGTSSTIPSSFEADDHTFNGGLSFFFNLNGVSDGNPTSGDAFLPGSPVETFSLAFTDGTGSFLSSNQNAGGFTGIPLAFDSINVDADGTSVISTGGIASRMGVTQTITLDGEDSYYTTTVTLTNLTGSAMSNIRYMRNNDPDQDVDSGGSFSTLNDVLSNPGVGHIAAVNAQGLVGGQNILLLADQGALNADNSLAPDTIEVRASAFGFANTNPFNISAFDVPNDPNGALGDIGINVVFAIDSLGAGQSVTFSWVTSANGTTGGGDVIMALLGQTTLDGAGGDDRIYASQAGVEETLIGGTGDDLLVGLGTSGGIGDVLIGGEGSDILVGSAGADILAGGVGADTFVYEDSAGLFTVVGNTSFSGAGATTDSVTDFLSGTDSLHMLQSAFGGMALGSLVNGVSYSVIAGSYDGTNAGINLNHALGQASFIYSQADHTLFFDNDGTGAGYQAVADIAQLAAGDIEVVASA